ncbi:MAG TPA: hypothetical protein VIP58_17035 [Nocardioides sp.]
MSTEYTPKGGDLAMITFGGSINENGPAFYVVEMDREDRWVFPDGTEEPASYPKSARPLLVVDPKDEDGVQALYDAIRKRQDVMPLTLEQVTTAVHDLLAPPPEEPKGLGAVVESFEGSVWVRGHHNNRSPWVRTAFGEHRSWDEIPTPLTVLHPGYTPEEQ